MATETIDFENDAEFAHHFENAGVETTIPVDDKQADGKSETDLTTPVDDKSSEGQQQSQDDKGSQAAAKDSSGSAVDGGDKSGPQKEGPSVASPESDEITLERLRRGETIHPNVIQRWYNQKNNAQAEATRQTQRVSQLETELGTLRTQVQTYENASKQIGSTDPETTGAALKLYNDLNQNPVQTLTAVVAQLKAAGYNVDNIAPGVDTAAISRLIDERLGKTNTQDGNAGGDEVVKEVNQFFSDYPDAVIHDDVLGNIIDAFPNISPVQAYNRLKAEANEKGLDWSKPLAPQMALRKLDASKAASGQEQNKQPDTPAMLNGRGAVNAVVERDPLDDVNAGENQTYADIIKQSMNEAGYKVN